MGPEVGQYVKAIYDFAAQQSGELSLQAGDIVKVTDVIDGNWLQGEAIYGASGSFPSNFVEPLILPDARMGQRVFVAVMDFPSEKSGDLELTKGDIILGTEQEDDNWWRGKSGPLRGIFPLSCVHELDVATEGPRSRSASLRCRSASLKARADSLATTSEAVFARALVDVVPQIEGELGFQTGDLITVTEVVDDDWFYGQCHNKVGLVSTICVEFLDDFGGDSEPGAGSWVPEPSSAGSDARAGRGGGSGKPEQGGSDPESRGVAGTETPAPSETGRCDENPLQHSVSYTSENTRSHDAEITPYAKTLYPFQAQLPTELSFGGDEIVTLIQHVDQDWIEGELDGKIGLFPATFVEIIVDCPYAYDTSSAPQPRSLESSPRAENGAGVAADTAKESRDSETVAEKELGKEESVSRNGGFEDSSSRSQPGSQALPPPPGDSRNGSCGDHPASAAVCDSSLALVLHSFPGEVQGDLAVQEGDTIEVLRIVDSDWLEARDERGVVGLVPKNHVEVISGAPQSVSSKTSDRAVSPAPARAARAEDSGPARNAEAPSGKGPAGGSAPSGVPCAAGVPSSTDSSRPGSGAPTSSVFQASQPESALVDRGRPGRQGPQPSPNHRPNQRSIQPAAAKPTPLPKPKLAPKPAIRPKPTLSPKPVAPAAPAESLAGRTVSPARSRAPAGEHGADGGEPDAKDRKVFADINAGLSLDNIVQAELEKAKSEGDGSRGSSFLEEGKQSRSGSFSSTVSEEHQAPPPPSDPPQQSGASCSSVCDSLGKTEGSSASRNARSEAGLGRDAAADEPRTLSVSHNDVGDGGGGVAVATRQNGGTGALSSSSAASELPALSLSPPSAPHLNRSVSDRAVSAAAAAAAAVAASKAREAPPTSKANHRHSMPPPARPIPPPPKADSGKRHSFVNPAFEHESEGQLLSLEPAGSSCLPPPPSRALPRPPLPALTPANLRGSASAADPRDLMSGGAAERRVKRPPPRPSGPRVASVPSKTPLQPVRADDGDKPVPHRPAPAAPGNRRSAPALPRAAGSLTLPAAPLAAVPPRPASVALAGSMPPRRPPPRLQKSPSDLMRFSPEPVIDEGDYSAELVADLKKRLQENRNDIQKYEHSKQELEKRLAEKEEDESARSETEESLQFVVDTLQGLKEEEKRLKGNLFSVSPREEKLEKAKLLEEQRATDERARREEEERNAAEQRAKHREKRRKVLQEILETEKDFLFDLQLCLTTFLDSDSAIKVPSCVDVEFLFGNMEEIADVSQRLLTSLESAISGKAFQDQIVGSTFVALAEDMKNTYAPYCRHHDDVIAVMEKYREIPEACQYFAAKVEEMRRHTNIFDVEAMLIKPVQRILKYPLLLHELVKCTEDDHPDKVAITNAIRAMTDVATAINEYKRRKDLVFKYKRDSDQSFAMKIAKLNFHSIKKKSSRMRGRLTTNLGIGLQLRDENFEYEETKFRSVEKAVKVLLRNVMSYLQHIQEVISCQENLAADISDYYGEKTCEEVMRYLTVHRNLLSHHKTLTDTVEKLVVVPLNTLVATFNGPNNVIDKRFDKLLDYNNMLGRGKDEKLVQAAKNDYEAMNAQLLDELPRLYQLTLTLMKHCMAAFVRAQRDFMDQVLKENCMLLEDIRRLQKLPSLLGGEENVMENFNIRHTSALDHISMLSFIPRGFNPKMDTFRLERRSSSRQSFDTSKPPPMVQSSSQSDSQRTYLRQMYGAESLYQVTQTMPAQDLMDMAVTVGTLVAVIKDKDPMGGRQRWFVDDGANKGFVQSSILVKAGTSPTGSLSSLTTDDMDEIASICSTSADDGENLPWLVSQSTPPYPDVTDVSQTEASSPSDQLVYEYYTAEYPFQARSSNEVSLQPGQVVIVLSHQDLDGNSEWWMVDADGYQGYAPANYLRKM